jgi:hypothetical protein
MTKAPPNPVEEKALIINITIFPDSCVTFSRAKLYLWIIFNAFQQPVLRLESVMGCTVSPCARADRRFVNADESFFALNRLSSTSVLSRFFIVVRSRATLGSFSKSCAYWTIPSYRPNARRLAPLVLTDLLFRWELCDTPARCPIRTLTPVW